ncbi:MAG TPA: hypothetical protein VEV87_04740 [Chitinophagaceae bacterium]|nr:hypothetical protein [Chitinophagaceae bacterium]
MKSILLCLFIALTLLPAFGQNNILLVQKKGKTIQNYFAGKFIYIETINKNFADGLITRITNDSIYIRHFEIEKSVTEYGGVYFDTSFRYTTAIHVNEIGAVWVIKKNSNRKRNGVILMVAGGGVMVLGAVNGLYRGDPPKDWYKPSGYITAGALIGLGYWMSRSATKKYFIGKKFQLKILPLSTR